MAPQTDASAKTSRQELTPAGPKRTDAQKRNGSGAKRSAGIAASPPAGSSKTNRQTSARPTASQAASMARRGGMERKRSGRKSPHVSMTGTIARIASRFEKNR